LHWLNVGRGGAHLTSDRSDDEGQFGECIGETEGRTHICPEIVEAPAEVLDEGVRGDDDPGGTVRFSPRIGRSRAFRRPWSASSALLAWTSVSWKAAGSTSSMTRG